MSLFDRILLCYDGTASGQATLRCGSALARQMNAEAHVLAILDCCDWSGGLGVPGAVEFDLDAQAATEILRDGVAKMRNSGVAATGHLLVGNPLDEIARLANILKVDLIVIGHRSGSAFARWWTRDNHAVLLRRVSCGVLFEDAPAVPKEIAELSEIW
jgi:nucleotide-binding universal stress UspA family protein